MDARSIIALTQLRARARGRPLDDKKPLKLEKVILSSTPFAFIKASIF